MNAWKQDADKRITDVIAEELDENAPFVTGWVLVTTYSDDDGDVCTAFNCMDDQCRTLTFGMLNHALKVEEARLFWDEKDED